MNPFSTASELAGQIRDGHCTSRDLTQFYIDRIERFDGSLNAVIARRFDEALAEADAADLRIAAEGVSGPLDGVPITVKESFDVAGLPTTWGHEKLRDNIPTTDAVAVARLRHAGAIVLGKTNIPRLLADWQTYNAVYGTTNNPWDVTRSPGGSSGGSAVAMAAGLSALELGSDIGASIRNPAHYCGVYGHKSSFKMASSRGQAPPGVVSEPDLAVIGPMARSAGDLTLGLELISGPDATDGRGWQLRLPPPRHAALKGLKVSVVLDNGITPLDADVSGVFMELVRFLRDAGADVREESFIAVERRKLYETYILMLRATTSRNHGWRELDQFRRELADVADDCTDYWTMARRAALLPHREWLGLNEGRNRLRLECESFFNDHHVIIMPIASTPAIVHNHCEPRHDRRIEINGASHLSIEQMSWAALATLCYLPATAVPIGLSATGLPIGAQIIGRQYDDLQTIGVASLLESDFHRFIPPPGY